LKQSRKSSRISHNFNPNFKIQMSNEYQISKSKIFKIQTLELI